MAGNVEPTRFANGVIQSPVRPGIGNQVTWKALQNALDNLGSNQGGGVLRIDEAGTYVINQPLVIKSNTTLYLGPGVRLKIANSTVGPMIQNTAWVNRATTFSVTSVTSSGLVATVTRTAHGRAVGDWISIAGSTTSGYNGTYQVQTVPGANSYTIVLHEVPGNTTAAGTIVERTADHDISIIGEGIWDGNRANRSSAGDYRDFGILLAHAGNINIDVKCENMHHRSVAFACVNEVRGSAVGYNCLGGLITFGTLANIDLDRIWFYDTDDDISGMQSDDYGVYEPVLGDIFKCRIRSLRGSTGQNGMKIITPSGYIADVTIDEVNVESGSHAINVINDSGVTSVGTTCRTLYIGSIHHPNPATNTAGVGITRAAGTTTLQNLIINEAYAKVPSGRTYWLVCPNNASAQVDYAKVNNVHLEGATNSQGVYLFNQVGKITRVLGQNIYMKNAANLYTQDSAGSESGQIVEFSNVELNGCASVISFYRNMTAYISNLHGAAFGNGAWSSDQAATLTVYAKNININAYYHNLSGSAKVTPYGGDIQIDGDKVTAAINVEFWNTSATFNGSSGVGRYIRNNGGTWTKVA